MNTVLRVEKKFIIPIDEFIHKSAFLENILISDKHNGLHGYPIRSLYFDSIDDDDYFEKAAGVELRRKIRLRIYDTNADFAMLEMKQKQGENQRKRSLRMTRDDAQDLISGKYDVLLKYTEPFAAECYGLMSRKLYKPKTIVEYNRKAFIAKENNIRITFDNRIKATESSFDLFSPNLLMNPVLDPYIVVMEVKYNGFLLSYIKDLINSTDRSELSVSKYVLARQNAYETHF